MYLAIALQLAHMPTKTWGACCNKAIEHVKTFHQLLGGEDDENIMVTKYGGTIQRWFRIWKASNHCFPNPHFVQNGKAHLPQLLDHYPDFHKKLVKEMEDNLAHLSWGYVFNYIVDTALPVILQQRHEELDNYEFTTKQLLEENGLTKLSLATIY